MDEGIRVSVKCKNVCGEGDDWADVVCLSNVVRKMGEIGVSERISG